MVPKVVTAPDFEEGRAVGPNEVVSRLSKRAFIALRGDAFVVIKKLEVEHAGVRDLQQHAEMLSKVNHPNLAHVYGCDETSDGVFWVSELVAGATLGELRAACKKAGKSLPLGVAFAAIHEAALVLGELHDRKRAHGDVRDSNIIVGFGGHARVLEPGVLDSLQRLAPDPRADLFALATLLYECLTGTVPAGPAFALPSSCNHALEQPVDDLLLRAIGPDRSRRFKTGAEFAQALKSAAGAYMWKVPQRGELVSSLFKERRAHLAQLVSNAAPRLEQLRAKRAADAVAAEEAARQAAFVAEQARLAPPPPPAFMEDPPPLDDDDDDDSRRVPSLPAPEIYSVPRRAMMGGFGAMVGIAACVFLVNALSGDAAPLGASAAVLAPPIPVLVQMKPPEAVAPAEATAAAAQAAPAHKVELATANDAPRAPEAAPKKKAARKKKPSRSNDGDAPLPPWLTK